MAKMLCSSCKKPTELEEDEVNAFIRDQCKERGIEEGEVEHILALCPSCKKRFLPEDDDEKIVVH